LSKEEAYFYKCPG